MMTPERINQILQEEIAKAKALGIKVEMINPIKDFPKAVSFYADCSREEVHNIRVSYYYLEASEQEIRETLMHEVLHAVKGSDSHGKIWQSNVNLVNEKYGYHISAHPYSQDRVCEYSLRDARDRYRRNKQQFNK